MMIFGPVLPYELLTSSRRARHFVVRTLYEAVLLATLCVHDETTFRSLHAPDTVEAMAEFAAQFFHSFSMVQILAVLALTPAMVAGTIAEEKDRKTIEYLLVTDLRNREIVLGKLAARLLHLFAHIAVGLPVLGLIRLLGGVSAEQVGALFAVTASTLLSSAGLSMLVSVHARRAREAEGATHRRPGRRPACPRHDRPGRAHVGRGDTKRLDLLTSGRSTVGLGPG